MASPKSKNGLRQIAYRLVLQLLHLAKDTASCFFSSPLYFYSNHKSKTPVKNLVMVVIKRLKAIFIFWLNYQVYFFVFKDVWYAPTPNPSLVLLSFRFVLLIETENPSRKKTHSFCPKRNVA